MSLIFDGHDLSELFYVGDPEITILNALPDLRDVPGRDGSAYVGTRYGNSNVTFTLSLEGGASERRDALSLLGMWLNVSEPKKLVLPDTPDRYYLAVPDSSLSLSRAIDADMAKVSFAIVDPVAYGREMKFTVSSGGSVTFNVAGTYKAKPVINASAAVRSGTSLVWGLLLDSSKHIRVATGSSSSRVVKFDCLNRVCTVANSVTLPTLTSDWLEFEPGTHTIQNDQGTGSCEVSYIERWL